MDELIDEIYEEMLRKGVSPYDANLALNLLDTLEHYEKMQREVRKLEKLNRDTVLAMAVLIGDNDL